MQNPQNTLADIMKMDVLFAGENRQGRFCACNGSQLVTHVFDTLQEVADRFGTRLVVNQKEFKYSTPYATGLADAKAGKPYEPSRAAGKQAVLEYGTGYLRGLVEIKQAAATVGRELDKKTQDVIERHSRK